MLKVPKVTSLQYLGKKEVTDIFFLHADKHQSFLEVDTIVLMAMAMHAQSTQNNKFAVSLQCLKKEGRHEVDFLHGDKPFYKLMLSILLSIAIHNQST